MAKNPKTGHVFHIELMFSGRILLGKFMGSYCFVGCFVCLDGTDNQLVLEDGWGGLFSREGDLF
ncbi:MAG: hypothetical protein ACK5M7_13000 [Draconibacterium sp.]